MKKKTDSLYKDLSNEKTMINRCIELLHVYVFKKIFEQKPNSEDIGRRKERRRRHNGRIRLYPDLPEVDQMTENPVISGFPGGCSM